MSWSNFTSYVAREDYGATSWCRSHPVGADPGRPGVRVERARPSEVGILAVPSTQEVPRRSVFHRSSSHFMKGGNNQFRHLSASRPSPGLFQPQFPQVPNQADLVSESTCSRDLELYFWPCKAPLPGWLGTYQILKSYSQKWHWFTPYSFKGFFFFFGHLKIGWGVFCVVYIQLLTIPGWRSERKENRANEIPNTGFYALV